MGARAERPVTPSRFNPRCLCARRNEVLHSGGRRPPRRGQPRELLLGPVGRGIGRGVRALPAIQRPRRAWQALGTRNHCEQPAKLSAAHGASSGDRAQRRARAAMAPSGGVGSPDVARTTRGRFVQQGARARTSIRPCPEGRERRDLAVRPSTERRRHHHGSGPDTERPHPPGDPTIPTITRGRSSATRPAIRAMVGSSRWPAPSGWIPRFRRSPTFHLDGRRRVLRPERHGIASGIRTCRAASTSVTRLLRAAPRRCRFRRKHRATTLHSTLNRTGPRSDHLCGDRSGASRRHA